MSPGITYTSTVTLRGITLTRNFEVEHLDIGQFDALVLDKQGAEYKILVGATKLLANFKSRLRFLQRVLSNWPTV